MKLSSGAKIALLVAGVAIATVLYAITLHNKAVTLDERVAAAWSQVLNQYKRRADLIPNLVNTVKGYAGHEKDVLTQVTEARAKAGSATLSPNLLKDPNAFEAFQKNQSALSSALSRLMVVVERYPDLKADKNFRALQAQLEGTENRIAVARRDYIEEVRAFNTMLRRFPASLILSITDPELRPRPTFTIEAKQMQTPQVRF